MSAISVRTLAFISRPLRFATLAPELAEATALAVSLALLETWAGIATAYVTNLPPSFWIVLLSCAGYVFALLYCSVRDARGRIQGASPDSIDRSASRATGCASVNR